MNKKYNSHRLKLNNILFWDEEKYEIILMDFSNGIYKETDKAYTIIFLFPEVLGGYNFSSNIKLDIMSSGILLFRMIERKYPFKVKKEKEIIHNILSNKINLMIKIKFLMNIKFLICKMLVKNGKLRI